MAQPSNQGSVWFHEGTSTPLIADQAQRMNSFMDAMADGHIDDAELAAQETRLVEIMREVEPLLSPELHEKVTQLLCELTAYDLMQIMHSLHQSKPKTTFRG